MKRICCASSSKNHTHILFLKLNKVKLKLNEEKKSNQIYGVESRDILTSQHTIQCVWVDGKFSKNSVGNFVYVCVPPSHIGTISLNNHFYCFEENKKKHIEQLIASTCQPTI